jgi:hypothetical protein
MLLTPGARDLDSGEPSQRSQQPARCRGARLAWGRTAGCPPWTCTARAALRWAPGASPTYAGFDGNMSRVALRELVLLQHSPHVGCLPEGDDLAMGGTSAREDPG